MRRLAAFLCVLGQPGLAQGFDQAVVELFADDPARYRAVIEGFQAALRASDAAAAAGFVDYPIEVEVGGDERIVRGPADFAAHFAEIVTPDIAAAVQPSRLSQPASQSWNALTEPIPGAASSATGWMATTRTSGVAQPASRQTPDTQTSPRPSITPW